MTFMNMSTNKNTRGTITWKTHGESINTHLHSCSRAGDAEGHRGAVAHVRVKALRKQLHHGGALLRGGAKKETETRDCRAADVIANVTHGHVEKAADGGVVGGGGVRHGGRVDAGVTDKRVLLGKGGKGTKRGKR